MATDAFTPQALDAASLEAALVALRDQRPSLTWMPTHVLLQGARPGVFVREVPGGWEDAGGGFIAAEGAVQ